eukprot:CAMPEP_0174288490 /NCGR_PEP_ID=MMETSP0809-20121228/20804_1 /TAXON_ID=73025 ORGANISM="Eutreptiella gymnastica-like, Strain CCMP1594" /NCGR_SAMPLE_ID=MMETSP0809 /ASSEMBLY_ACC=CAM_ASM_000658 /LENGTH=157 /DNA_ID=CAMNT_0015385719 /DNA_START=900 /DNA_END=1373 /DNA_ORIENTATION=-
MATVLLCCFCHATDDASNTAHAWIKGPQESKPDPEYNYEPTLPYPCALPVLCGLSGNHLDLCLFLCLEGLHAIFKFFGQGSFFCNDRWPDIHLASDNVLAGYQHKPQIARELAFFVTGFQFDRFLGKFRAIFQNDVLVVVEANQCADEHPSIRDRHA